MNPNKLSFYVVYTAWEREIRLSVGVEDYEDI